MNVKPDSVGKMKYIFYRKNQDKLEISQRQEHLGPTRYILSSFIEDSKKRQSFYSNCEGAYDRRVVSIKDTEYLNIFISCTLFSQDNYCCMSVAREKNLMVEKIRNEIIKMSQKFNTPDEIHFSVVWVFYYDYEKAESKAMPLFKMYKTKHSQEAIFLDMFLKKYDGWDSYLDNAYLPYSFACVPRNGNYVFQPGSESLDLIYVFFSKGKLIPDSETSVLSFNGKFTPFCENLLRHTFHISKRVSSAPVDFIKNLVSHVVGFLREKTQSLSTKVISLVSLLQSALVDKHSEAMTIVSNIGCMLLDNPKLVSPEKKSIGYGSDEVRNFSKLLNATSLDWNKIFQSFAEICQSQHIAELFKSVPHVPVALRIIGLSANLIAMVISASRGKESKDAPPSIVGDSSPISRNPPISPAYPKEKLMKTEPAQKSGIDPKYSPVQMNVDDSFPGKLYFFPSANLAEITEGFQGILKNFKFKPRNVIVHDVIDEEDRVQASLFHVSENSAFAYVPSKT